MATLERFNKCLPSGKIYLIIESVFQKQGVPTLGNTVGPSLTQVQRQIYTECDVQDRYFKGKRIDENASAWQMAEILFNQGKIETRPTGASIDMLVYVGTRNELVPVQQLRDWIPVALTKPLTLSKAFSPTPFGVDPIPAIQLYGNKAISFISVGGDSPPTAMALYHTDTHKLELLGAIEIARIFEKLGK
jgi:hypothetical protein